MSVITIDNATPTQTSGIWVVNANGRYDLASNQGNAVVVAKIIDGLQNDGLEDFEVEQPNNGAGTWNINFKNVAAPAQGGHLTLVVELQDQHANPNLVLDSASANIYFTPTGLEH